MSETCSTLLLPRASHFLSYFLSIQWLPNHTSEQSEIKTSEFKELQKGSSRELENQLLQGRTRTLYMVPWTFHIRIFIVIWKALTNYSSSLPTVLQYLCGPRMNGFVLRRFCGNYSWSMAWEKKNKFSFAWSEKIGSASVHSLAQAKCELRRCFRK